MWRGWARSGLVGDESDQRAGAAVRAAAAVPAENGNELLSRGFTLSGGLARLESANAALPPKARVSKDSLHKHARLHFNMQAPAGAIWRRIQEQRAAESGVDYESGIVSLVNAAQLPRDDDAQGVRDAG